MSDDDGPTVEPLAETALTSFSVCCPRCGTTVAQLDLRKPGALTGFEAVCPGCEFGLFPGTAAAVGDTRGDDVDIPTDDLAAVVREYQTQLPEGVRVDI